MSARKAMRLMSGLRKGATRTISAGLGTAGGRQGVSRIQVCRLRDGGVAQCREGEKEYTRTWMRRVKYHGRARTPDLKRHLASRRATTRTDPMARLAPGWALAGTQEETCWSGFMLVI